MGNEDEDDIEEFIAIVVERFESIHPVMRSSTGKRAKNFWA